MDLTVLRKYFQACQQAECQLHQYWSKFSKLPAYSLFKIISTQSQPKLDSTLIRQFLITFNWQVLISSTAQLQNRPLYKIHSFNSQKNPEQLLDYGLQLLINNWGSNNTITFQQFCLLVKGEQQLPSKEKQISFGQKKQLFECLMNQIQHLIKLQSLKKVVYHQYRNLSDLFEIITSKKLIQEQSIKNLFLSFSIRKTEKQLRIICKRAKIPWSFNSFINQFKKGSEPKPNEHKVHYSSTSSRKHDINNDKAFTTPRKQKHEINQSSTKLTKNIQSTYASPTKLHTFSSYQFQSQQKENEAFKYTYVEILADLLKIQEQFIMLCDSLVKRRDFDLELVYERHGKKFEKVLVERYGVCNFSAFVRFIVPRQYQHRYLCFIRYQANNELSQQTQNLINELLQKYKEKEKQIQIIWKRCDRQLLLRHFCHPRQNSIRSEKLSEIFSTRQKKILLERLDPHQKGQIQIEALN